MADVLLASDAPWVVEEVLAAVAGPEVEVRTVPTGVDVLPAVLTHEPDLVILDQQIGNMGGMAACMHLRLEESGDRIDHVPVLMLLDRRADVFLARRCGAEGWLVKPVDSIRLRRAVEALLGGGTYHDRTEAPLTTAVDALNVG